jgi:hypothetical protein
MKKTSKKNNEIPKYIEKFAWLPTSIKTGQSDITIIWLQKYALRRHMNLPTLCDCQIYPCEHNNPKKGYYKTPADYKKLGFFTIQF